MILKDAGFGNFEKIIITCVDPQYPVRSLGDEFVRFDVSYTDTNEQRTEAATARLDLRIRGDGRFSCIRPEAVRDFLNEGVVQLSQVDEVMVMGIPGDVYAFYPEGTGFGFGKPYAVRPEQARQLLRALAAYGHSSEVVAMIHPDCMLVAHNEGKYQVFAGEPISPFPTSPYGIWEKSLKQDAAESLRIYVETTLKLHFRAVSPPYVERRPGVLKVRSVH